MAVENVIIQRKGDRLGGKNTRKQNIRKFN